MNDRDITKKVVEKLKSNLNSLPNVPQVAIHGSLVQGKQLSEVSDGDLLVLLNGYTELRVKRLSEIKEYISQTVPEVKKLLGSGNQKPVSPTILTESEFRWGIVKTKYGDNFFDTCTYSSLKPVVSDFWSAENLLRYRHEAWRASSSNIISTIITGVKVVQKARAEYCVGTALEADEAFDLKAICRLWYTVLGKNADEGNDGDVFKGFNLLLKGIPSDSSLRSPHRALAGAVVIANCNPDNQDLMLLWEYTLDMLLEKLNELIPPIDELFKDYNKKVQQGWLDQWGYARDPNGAYLGKDGHPLRGDNNNAITDWEKQHERIVKEGLNTGSVEYADLFAQNPNQFGPTHLDEPTKSSGG